MAKYNKRYFYHSKGIMSCDKIIFSICDGLLGRHINVAWSKLGNLKTAIFSKSKTLSRCNENLHGSLFLRDLLLDLKSPCDLFGRHLMTKNYYFPY